VDRQRQFLNVGGGNKAIPVPRHYLGWRHLMLDIDPAGNPDICADARDMLSLDAQSFDAVYCSHNLEHYFEHDVPKVLAGFRHVLRDDGFAEIRVPDIQQVMLAVAERGLDIEDGLYDAPAGAIRVRDVLYGFADKIARSGEDFFAHKTGFSPASLTRALNKAGFDEIVPLRPRIFEIAFAAFRGTPDPATVVLLSAT
jgi:predicted SAM-dependent methyltransferase